MARYKEEIDARYYEWCDAEMERMAAMLGHKVRKTPENNLLKQWKEPKTSASELLERCRNRIDFLQILSEEENTKIEIEARLEKQRTFVEKIEQFLTSVMG